MANMTFRNSFQIKEGLKQVAHQALAEIARETYNDWYDMISERLYKENWLKVGEHDSGYKRSYDVLNSLELKWITPLECEIGYNTDKIRAVEMGGGFNRHMSVSGADWSEAIPYFVEFGNHSTTGNSPIVEYDGIGALTWILNTLKYSFNTQLKKALEKRGMKIQ